MAPTFNNEDNRHEQKEKVDTVSLEEQVIDLADTEINRRSLTDLTEKEQKRIM